jgi:CBS domain-containing protein
MEVRYIMAQPVQTIENTDTVQKAAEEMAQHQVGMLAVRAANRLVGIITDRDLVVRCIALGRPPARTIVGSIMSSHPVTLEPDSSIDRAVHIMASHHVHRLPVMEDGRLVGILSASDIARHFHDEGTITELVQTLADPGVR